MHTYILLEYISYKENYKSFNIKIHFIGSTCLLKYSSYHMSSHLHSKSTMKQSQKQQGKIKLLDYWGHLHKHTGIYTHYIYTYTYIRIYMHTHKKNRMVCQLGIYRFPDLATIFLGICIKPRICLKPRMEINCKNPKTFRICYSSKQQAIYLPSCILSHRNGNSEKSYNQ